MTNILDQVEDINPRSAENLPDSLLNKLSIAKHNARLVQQKKEAAILLKLMSAENQLEAFNAEVNEAMDGMETMEAVGKWRNVKKAPVEKGAGDVNSKAGKPGACKEVNDTDVSGEEKSGAGSAEKKWVGEKEDELTIGLLSWIIIAYALYKICF